MTEQTDRTIEQAIDYARQKEEVFLERFQELLRIPSISADPAHKGDVQRAAEWLVGEMHRVGLKDCQALPSSGHPVAYAEWLEAGDDRPTLLVYAHYDVQPVDPLDLWDSPPLSRRCVTESSTPAAPSITSAAHTST
jgi:acetylornithine deacetylase/succinyl-diaminopimelate desuccinylase-like protein